MSVPVLRARSLTHAGFVHGFSTRAGGVSAAPFDTLDFALDRDPSALKENVGRWAEACGFDPKELYQARQVHGAHVLEAAGDARAMWKLEADALVAPAGSNAAVGVRVADCVPVLIGDAKTGGAVAIHAGWRGIVAGVIVAAGFRLVGSASHASQCVAAIGPCIGPCCFEVGADVAVQIAAVSNTSVIARREGDKAFVDLRAAVRHQLRALGIDDSAVDDVPSAGSDGCTRCNAREFYSFRRDGNASGRLLAVITAK